MSEANETNDILTKIKEQIMIATHETGEMPNIMKSKKKADSNRGYFYDAQNNILYLRDEQTWNAIKDNLSADLSSDDMGINVSIQPLQGIDGYQGESIEDLQDKVDKVNRENHHEYYRLIKRGDYDCLLCYSFNNVADRDRFAAEMDDAFGVGNSDVSDEAKFDKYDDDDEEIDEDFSDEKVLDVPSHRKQNDNGKQKDTRKEKAKVNKKKQKDDKKKKSDDDKEKKDDDDITKDNEEGEQEVTLVEELGDTLVNQTGGTQVNDNSVSGNAPGAEKPAQSIEARFAAVNNGQPLPNRYAYLEQYCRIAKEFGEPDGYSLSKNMDKRKAFAMGGQGGKKDLQVTSRENLLMHMLADILPAIADGKVKYYRGEVAGRKTNTLYIGGTTATVNFDSVLNNERVRNSVFSGYFRSLINNLKPLAELMNLNKGQAAECVINFVMNDIGLMREFLDGVAWGSWRDNQGVEMTDLKTFFYGNSQHSDDIVKVILPYGWMRGEDFKQVALPNGQKKWRLTPRTVGFSDINALTYQQYAEVNTPKGDSMLGAASIAFSCGDVFPSGDLKKDLYYCTWVGRDFPGSQTVNIVRDNGGTSCNTYFGANRVNKRKFIEVIKQARVGKRGKCDFLTTYFSPACKEGNLKKLLTEAERSDIDTPQVVFEDVGSRFTPPIIRNYEITKQNLDSGRGSDVQLPF